MIMRRIIMTLSAAALLCTGAIAQRKATPAAPTSSVTPQSLLERAEASLYRTGATVVDFSTQLQDKAGRSTGSTTGKMHLQGDAFRLEYGTITAVYTAGTLTYYDSAEHTLTISKPSQDELLQINPLYFLRSRAQGFASQLEGKSGATAVVACTPQQKSNISRVVTTFQTSNGIPTQLVFTAKDKSVLTARVAKVSPRTAYAASFFTLSAKSYPGCEVVDLR